jgi:hypothetical protein
MSRFGGPVHGGPVHDFVVPPADPPAEPANEKNYTYLALGDSISFSFNPVISDFVLNELLGVAPL